MANYATTDQLIIRVNMLTAPTADQLTMLEELIEAASRAIDSACRRGENAFEAVGAGVAKYFTAFGEAFLRIPSCSTITEVAVKASLTATSYTAWVTPTTPMAGDGDWIPCRGEAGDPSFDTEPYNLLIIDLNGDYSVFLDGDGAPVVKITASWGTETGVPAEIREFTLMQAALWAKSYEGSGADETGSIDFGRITIRRALSKQVRDGLVDGGWVLPLYGGA